MPKNPMVGVYFLRIDGAAGQATPADIGDQSQHYLEDWILLRVAYRGEVGWYPLSVPINSYAGWLGGNSLGWPKYLATMAFDPSSQGWHAGASVLGKPTMTASWRPAAAPISDSLAMDAKFEHPLFLLSPTLTGPGAWRADLSISPPTSPTTLAEPRRGRAHIVLDPNLNRVDAESPTPLPHLFDPGESLADLVKPDQVVPATFRRVDADALVTQQMLAEDGG